MKVKYAGADGDGDIEGVGHIHAQSFHLLSFDPPEGEQEWLHFHNPWDLGDLWLPEDTSLELEVFLAVAELGHLGVEVLELCPELW